MTEIPYVRQSLDFETPVHYAYGPDSSPQPDVPHATTVEFEWNESAVFPGTTRRVWVHVPAQYTPSEPASLMVFQDGWMYLDPDGDYRCGVVFDNLIHRGEMPVTIGVFVDPGEVDNRNTEYDSFSDAYALFLLTEILPAVREQYAIADDPERWAVCGGSSGGICAFTVAWLRPERFRRVLTFVAAFPQLRGAHYPELIRDVPRKPLRIFMQAASRDLYWNEAEQFNFFSTNLRVAAALAERGYDHRLVVGDGGHNPNHGGAILPDALRWLWRPATSG